MDSELIGRQLGQYRISEVIGSGGMATVYKAYQASMDRYVALKLMHPQFGDDEEFTGRFEQEAKVIAKLEHPNIVPIFDFGKTEDYTFIAMRFVEGTTLSEILKNDGPLPLERVRKILTQVGNALDYAHSRGVIHRDVKPSNVLIDQHGNCFLNDFGFAKLIESKHKLSLSGNAIGTPAYMSPEQIMGQELDGRSDVYSLGIVLYEMLTGRAPYEAETPSAIFVKHITDTLTPPRDYNPTITDSLERIIFRSLSKQPDERFAAVSEFVEAIQHAIDDARIESPPGSEPLNKTAVFAMPGRVDVANTAPPRADQREKSQARRERGISTIVFPVLIGLLIVGAVGAAIALGGNLIAAPPVAPETTGTPDSATATPVPDNGTTDAAPVMNETQQMQTVEAAVEATSVVRATQDSIAATVAAGELAAAALTATAENASPTPSPTAEGQIISVVFRECRGYEGSIIFANNAIQSFHAYDRLVFYVRPGTYTLTLDWPGHEDANFDGPVEISATNNYFQFGSDCR